MCGLVGIMGPLVTKDEAAIKRLLLFDYLRGTDATGVAAVRMDGSVEVAKLATDPITIFQFPRFNTVVDGNKSHVFIGHNRAATIGLKTNYNAHPFHVDHVVGAHNGTLSLRSQKALEDALGEKFGTDSEALFAAIARLGVKEAIGLCEEGKTGDVGAWSLTWYDQSDNTMNFLRNQHRPMWFAYEKEFKRLFWASDWWMLSAMAEASGFEIEGVNGYKFHASEIDTHYKFDVEEFLTATGQPKPVIQKIEGKEPPAVVQSVFPSKGSGTVCGFQIPKPKTDSGKTSRSPDNVLHWYGTDGAPYAGVIDEERFRHLARDGCSWCKAELKFGDEGVTVLDRDDIILCSRPCCSGIAANENAPQTRIVLAAPAFEALA
jgi:predicted glutamine amidotransferase